MSDLAKLKAKLMESPEFREEYENTRADFEVMKAIIDARCDQNITQEELAKKSGIRQSNISRIENGTCSPTIHTLKQIAKGLDRELHIEFRKVSAN
ncbi:MAG: helix-turn-helix domain-containing protein [Coriobacteriia bacterium]|nr:helix-turn-helix domain-containing protein [Coriobacteriia bacterium]MCL2750419.1 helix-turn-helix domain-containing protein [Coriobacteriia bacterium]